MEAMYTSPQVLFDIEETETKMYRACEQVVIMDRKLKNLKKRFTTATKNGHRPVRYNLKIQISTLEGVRAAYRTYAVLKSEEVVEMTKKLLEDDEWIKLQRSCFKNGSFQNHKFVKRGQSFEYLHSYIVLDS